MMRVVVFSFRTHHGGADRSEVEFAKRLKEHVDVSMVDPDGHCEPHADAVRQAGIDLRIIWPDAPTTIIGGKGQGWLYRLWRMCVSLPMLWQVRGRSCAVLRELDPSVVITSNVKSGAIVALSPSLRHIPLVVHLRGWYTPDMFPWYGKWLCRRRCQAVFALSRATKAAAICAGIDHYKIHVLHNPIDVDDMIARANRPLEDPLPQADRPVRILLPAGIMRTKGQHTAVKAMRRILDAGHDAVLWLAGDFQPIGKNKPYLAETKALARRIGVAERVQWLGLRDDMPQVMKACTIMVLPSHTEGQGRVFLEAMSLAKPVAATPVGGILDMILPEVTGLFFEVEDDAGLARCVDRFVSDPEAAARMGRQAQDYARRSFRVEDHVQRALELLRRIAR